MSPNIKATDMNMTGDRSSISATFLVERSTTRLEKSEGGPYSKLMISISFLVFSLAGSDIIIDTKKASTATPKKMGTRTFAELMACLLM